MKLKVSLKQIKDNAVLSYKIGNAKPTVTNGFTFKEKLTKDPSLIEKTRIAVDGGEYLLGVKE